ncbi:hypothetical protein EIN_362080 [Entamoeba invadens IP1]|uniref:Uncharacterized protein n=1 Tax=Entamoeba invadens IP1 TaxID=370355 RepID=A0A0A1U812_ENTIV|nr:hypothetical protein EIN_362080 [Entamoeba invadens IP1]ELP90935.1 hypothetical protein EIN_362080 [Entamoeba invadens IP1]|eukprot:XP_004257706.1 hypothetical protein EIN_362080 [Entamoeba invadens IP1]
MNEKHFEYFIDCPFVKYIPTDIEKCKDLGGHTTCPAKLLNMSKGDGCVEMIGPDGGYLITCIVSLGITAVGYTYCTIYAFVLFLKKGLDCSELNQSDYVPDHCEENNNEPEVNMQVEMQRQELHDKMQQSSETTESSSV